MKPPADGWDRDEADAIEHLQDPLNALRARRTADPPVDLLQAGRLDALPPDLQASMSERLEHDAWSRALLEGLDAGEPALAQADEDRLLARIQREARRGEPRRWTWASFRPLLAGAATIAIATTIWIASRPDTSSVNAPVAAPPTSTEAPPPVQVYQLPLEKPDVTLSLAAMTWRGARTGGDLLTDLKGPLDAYRAGDYARADRELAQLESRYPKAVEVFFYGGVSRLFLNEPQRALASLTKASDLADATFAPQVSWYRAIAAQRAGDPAAARRLLEALCARPSDRAAQACEAVKQIDATSKVPQP